MIASASNFYYAGNDYSGQMIELLLQLVTDVRLGCLLHVDCDRLEIATL